MASKSASKSLKMKKDCHMDGLVCRVFDLHRICTYLLMKYDIIVVKLGLFFLNKQIMKYLPNNEIFTRGPKCESVGRRETNNSLSLA